MGSLNKVMLIGRLGRDPEVRYTQSGAAVANFSIATDESRKDKSGQKQERTEWHDIVCWNKLADLAQQYLVKGKQVYVEGRLTTRSWDDKNTGQKRYKTEIEAREIQFLDGRGDGQERTGTDTNGQGRQQPRQGGGYGGQRYAPRGGQGYQPQAQGPPDTRHVEDDIPF